MVGLYGGGAAVWAALGSWGMLSSTMTSPPLLQGNVNGVRVIILGAGLGGETAAYELGRLGYDCIILEARDRAGGRNWTVREGTELDEWGGERQVCDFDEGQYANLGPWRIPHHHESVLYYLREFNVPVEAFINFQSANYVYVEGDHGPLSGMPVRMRELQADMGGYTAELLAKAAQQNGLNDDLSQDDLEQLLQYLRYEGLLNENYVYEGSSRRGYRIDPGAATQAGEVLPRFDFRDLLPYASEIMQAQGYYIGSVAAYSQQMTMLQPVGGMDRISAAFEERLNGRIRLNAEVQEIRQEEDSVRIVYRDTSTDETSEITGDYCFCNIPLPVLYNIPGDFDPQMREAMGAVQYAQTGKIGLQFSRRFWETDDRIYGGTTRTNVGTIGDIAYPSYGFLTQKGVIQGYYNFGVDAIRIGNLSMQDRIEHALEYGERIHPGKYRENFETGFSVAWQRVPYNLGGWAEYDDHTRAVYYPRLLEPDGRIYLIGEHLSHLTGWQAGAIESAWVQIEKLHRRVMEMEGIS